jgi:hypothetical protein
MTDKIDVPKAITVPTIKQRRQMRVTRVRRSKIIAVNLNEYFSKQQS